MRGEEGDRVISLELGVRSSEVDRGRRAEDRKRRETAGAERIERKDLGCGVTRVIFA